MNFNIKARLAKTIQFKDLKHGDLFTLETYLTNPGDGFRRVWMKVVNTLGPQADPGGNCICVYSEHNPDKIGTADLVLVNTPCFKINGELTMWLES